ncbi:acyl carrier protein [Piscinibacter terrae]|uniref:Acyl carrier protein n=1 Tax=Piscinibacter terrae TaxID=2496871 RepID=A0A3N7JTC6_9BURK|nr:acyl carrier protein [Albitalea terrae]RQP22225.1 acyl carrier protein [Albitalea terrae]
MKSIKEQLRDIVAERLEMEPDAVDKADRLEDHGDSLAFLDLVSEVEKVFDIRISNEELDKLTSFADLVGVVEQSLLARA